METCSPTTSPIHGEPLPMMERLESRKELYGRGKALRQSCPRESHASWEAPGDRQDPVSMVERSEIGRVPELLPLRHGRMVRSAFTFYRGAALIMAADLARTPTTGINVQACGDAHLCNFGGFATPERRVLFSNQKDHGALEEAVRSGRVEAKREEP